MLTSVSSTSLPCDAQHKREKEEQALYKIIENQKNTIREYQEELRKVKNEYESLKAQAKEKALENELLQPPPRSRLRPNSTNQSTQTNQGSRTLPAKLHSTNIRTKRNTFYVDRFNEAPALINVAPPLPDIALHKAEQLMWPADTHSKSLKIEVAQPIQKTTTPSTAPLVEMKVKHSHASLDEKGEANHLFVVCILQQKEWEIEKFYTEFVELDRKLRLEAKEKKIGLPSLPAKPEPSVDETPEDVSDETYKETHLAIDEYLHVLIRSVGCSKKFENELIDFMTSNIIETASIDVEIEKEQPNVAESNSKDQRIAHRLSRSNSDRKDSAGPYAQRRRSKSADNSKTSFFYNILKKTETRPRSKFQQKSPVFGVSLDDALRVSKFKDTFELPSIVYHCIEYLEKNDKNGALGEVGIYRLSGNHAHIEELQSKCDEGKAYSDLLKGLEYNEVAGLLKLWFRKLTAVDPLLPDEFLKAIELKNETEKLETVMHLISELPLAKYTVLRALFTHLHLVALNSENNKMTPTNLSRIFGATLCQGSIIDTYPHVKLVRTLLENCKEIFCTDKPNFGENNKNYEEYTESAPKAFLEREQPIHGKPDDI